MTNATTIAALCALILAATAHTARGASFDCVQAKSTRELLICGDAKLSEIDGKLGSLYKERLTLLSPTGADLLRQSQRNWLDYANRTCPLVTPRGRRHRDPASCLRYRYEERVNELAKVGQKIGPFRFNRVDIYTLRLAKDENGKAPGFYVRHVAYPQIDNPDSNAVIAWNKRQAGKTFGRYCDEPGDDDDDFEIGYASSRFISLRWFTYFYCHGTAHGTFSSTSENLLLQSELRTATGEDIFGSAEAAWARPLQTLFWNAILSQGWKPPRPNIEGWLKDEILKSNRWLFTADGLHYEFDAYEGGCYVCNPKPVTLSWESLKPLLSTNSVVP